MLRFFLLIFVASCFAACEKPPAAAPPIALVKDTTPMGMETQAISFPSGDLTLSALLDTPSSGQAEALVIFVHGYGETNVVEQNWYYNLRSRFAAQGVSSFVWDKPGRGNSEGVFDPNQPVQSSAIEVLDAARFLRENNVAGSQKIGIWGVSRAGWIAPLAMAQDNDIEFWISVSGVDDKESFGYLLTSNWRLDGYSEEKITKLYGQWLEGIRITTNKGTFEDYRETTLDLRQDPFFAYMTNSTGEITQSEYKKSIADYQKLKPVFDEATGLMIYVEQFEDILSELDVHTLAIFGEKDSIVDWRAAKLLYENTIGQNSQASLTVASFPDGNHNLHKSETGAFKEMIAILNSPEMSDGYYSAISNWLDETVLKAK